METISNGLELRLISRESLLIGPSNGAAVFAKSKNVFKSHLDPDFRDLTSIKSKTVVKEVLMSIHEIVGEGTFAQIFALLKTDWKNIKLSQAEAIEFCKKYPDLLCQGGFATFFPIDDPFIAMISVEPDGLDAYLSNRHEDYKWLKCDPYDKYFRRLVTRYTV